MTQSRYGHEFAQVVALKAVRIRVAREVEPGPRPLLAVLRHGEQLIRQRLDRRRQIALRRRHEGIHFAGRRRQADEIEMETPRQDVGIGRGRWRQLLAFQPGANEGIDGVGDFPFRQSRADRGNVGPVLRLGRVFRPRRARLDPGAETFDLRGGERLAPVRHHFIVALRQLHAPEQLAFLRLAGHDRRPVIAALESRLAAIEPQVPLLLLRAVALETRPLENGIDVFGEIDGGAAGRACQVQAEQCGEDGAVEEAHAHGWGKAHAGWLPECEDGVLI